MFAKGKTNLQGKHTQLETFLSEWKLKFVWKARSGDMCARACVPMDIEVHGCRSICICLRLPGHNWAQISIWHCTRNFQFPINEALKIRSTKDGCAVIETTAEIIKRLGRGKVDCNRQTVPWLRIIQLMRLLGCHSIANIEHSSRRGVANVFCEKTEIRLQIFRLWSEIPFTLDGILDKLHNELEWVRVGYCLLCTGEKIP